MTFEDQIVRGSFTGTTSADVVEVSLPSMSAAMVQLTGTFSATTTFEVLVDEGSSPTWKALSATNVTTGAAATTATTAGVYSVNVAGARRFRARCSTFVSGTVVVAVNVSRGSAGGGSSSGGGGGGAATIADGADTAEGTTTDAGVVTDTSGTVIGFLRGNIIKWIAQALLLGAVNETAPATDTASSGQNGRLQRIAQRITSLIALLPASLGGKAAASSLAVTLATDEPLVGILTETAPATDTASSGLNGRLQRIAQRITSLIALVPAALTGSGNFKVSVAESTATVTVDTELPAAAALSDSTANPTTVMVGAATMGWDTTNWERCTLINGSADARGNVASVGLVHHAFGMAFNGTTWDRVRTASADGLAATGLLAAGNMGWNGSTWDRMQVDATSFKQHRVVAAGYTTVLTSTLTRPNDTTAYTAGDEMTDTGGAIQTITGAARYSGGSGIIQGIYVSQSTLWTTKPAMEIWIYDTTSTPVADNGAFAPTDGVTDTCIAVIPVTATYAGTVNQALDSGQISVPFVTSGSANLFFRIVIRNAAQDSAVSGVSKFRFRILQD